jgi:hypothetical protein
VDIHLHVVDAACSSAYYCCRCSLQPLDWLRPVDVPLNELIMIDDNVHHRIEKDLLTLSSNRLDGLRSRPLTRFRHVDHDL